MSKKVVNVEPEPTCEEHGCSGSDAGHKGEVKDCPCRGAQHRKVKTQAAPQTEPASKSRRPQAAREL